MGLIKKGKDEAFDVLYRRHFGKLYVFFLRSTGDEELSRDLSQEVMIKIYRSATRYEERARFTTFLYTVARNTLLNHFRDDRWREQSANHRVGNLDAYDHALNTHPAPVPDPSQVAEEMELREMLKRALENLPENLKTPFLMAQLNDMSYREIGEVMGISEQAVKLRIFRAREFIARQIGAER